MAYYSNNIWAEEDGPNFNPPCLESFMLPVEGKIYVMYHGTSADNATLICRDGFRQSKDGMLGPGVYVSRDLRKASRYPLTKDASQKVVLKLLVNVGKVKKIDRQGHPLQKTWHQQGYDTAWCPPICGMVQSGLEEDCVWDPRRIKVTEVHKEIPSPKYQSTVSNLKKVILILKVQNGKNIDGPHLSRTKMEINILNRSNAHKMLEKLSRSGSIHG